MSKNKHDGIFIDLTTSCTVDNALRDLLGIGASTSIDHNEIKLADVDTLENLLSCILEDAETDNSNVKFLELYPENTPDLESLNKAKRLIFNASRFRNDIIDEIAKGNKSKLKIDLVATKVSNRVHITKSSLNEWALKKYGIGAQETSSTAKPQEQSDKPWSITDPRDPKPVRPWYTAARYFARQLIKSDSTLGEKRNLLVIKIAQEFTNVGIFKRGEKKHLSPETIKKALSNIELK